MKRKELLQKKLSDKKYYDICKFVEEVYLMDYDLLILMARKFFNLFCVFNELNKEKYERMGIPYAHTGEIISNRALPLLRKDIKEGKYKKVVIADDIIIHGRSIREVYDELEKLWPDIEVIFASYMRNEDEGIAYDDIRRKINSRYVVETEEWREMSDEIVRTFYLSGRPYISYLPFFSLDIPWKELIRKLDMKECLHFEDDDMRQYEIEAVLYTGKELEQFSCLKSCEICSIRFYHYSLIGEVLAVPYYSMDAIEENSLRKLSDFARRNWLAESYLKLIDENNGADNMRAMELEYVLSTWMAMGFFDQQKIPIKVWHRDIEDYNFRRRLLPQCLPNNQEITERIKKLREFGKSFQFIRPAFYSDGYLEREYKDLQKVYKKNYDKWMTSADWKKQNQEKGSLYLFRFAQNHLAVNGNIDESRWRDGEANNKRLYGISLSDMIDDLARFLAELKHEDDKWEKYKKNVFAVIIMSVDSGKGTIVKRVIENKGKKYHESLIYAGEQNYKFYENTNFPALYGLYLIEKRLSHQQKENYVHRKKEDFLKKLMEYMDKENYFYIGEEMRYLAKKWNLGKEYGVFLQNSYYKYCQNPVLEKAVDIALDICEKIDNEVRA